ncbi:hypothetical protein [Priestia megaterium]|uniref:hypothetical protein n=1 Tax=Priestia megaterium TaxID=1404 RepID=UPI00366E759A
MNRRNVILGISIVGALIMGSLSGCSSEEKPPAVNNDTSSKQSNLQKYTKYPEKHGNQDEDFDLVGTLDKETKDELILTIDNNKVTIPKRNTFKKEDAISGDIKGKLVKVEVNTKDQNAKSLELTPQAKANDDGIYEKESDGDYKVIGKLISETSNEVTIEVKNGKNTYKKTMDFEKDDDNTSQDIQDKLVRLEIKKNNQVESLEIELEDQ